MSTVRSEDSAKVRTACLDFRLASRMVSIVCDAVAGLRGLSFTLKGVIAGKVHRVTRAATTRSDLYMLQDAPSGLFVVLDE